ncbi:MAG: M20/M25/M40 family metallo-hydrolase, partial [Pseudomonadota bacterium]
MNELLDNLRALVAFDTRNPPRTIAGDGGIFAWLRDALAGFHHDTVDLGGGCVSLLAVRGEPTTVFNVHVDTVPDSPHWSGSPHELRVADDRATGLGACDIKGAAACLIAAAKCTTGPLALLFTSDEEHDGGRCVGHFLAQAHGFARAIVAEPTGCTAVLAHRGIASVKVGFTGVAGHSSKPRALTDNALHRAAAWTGRAVAFAGDSDHRYQNLEGLAFNVGTVHGGIKNNVIAPEAT